MSENKYYEQIGVAMTCRSYQEYKDMFMLDERILKKGSILDVASGASSFITDVNNNGNVGIAIDPLYQLSAYEMEKLGKREIQLSSDKLANVQDSFLWDYYTSLDQHIEIRQKSFQKFIESYTHEKGESYISGSLPHLPFADDSFSLILCNHFLFLYQDQFDFTFHVNALNEMIRVLEYGGEIRIYPIVGFKNELYPYLDELKLEIEKNEVEFDLIPTHFSFLPNANHYLQIKK
ncbi:class I SAM-dependent methyltransferase [Metabacillus litoralis]|uniref:Class I SAM-dependent methyltransferase n=1 Tax=Metabacillus litoralis TaxID=152268 RepID=A0A5C6VNA2_9BACI|nr:methyltransferase domain-containing protein [Metabacillus litoralis]TXC86026.1 class I SAM-dependent methyltransferase [Metabacillus litoralis]